MRFTSFLNADEINWKHYSPKLKFSLIFEVFSCARSLARGRRDSAALAALAFCRKTRVGVARGSVGGATGEGRVEGPEVVVSFGETRV